MNKFFYILGVLTLIVLAVIGIGLGATAYKGHELDVESKVFVDSAVTAIAERWSEDQLLNRATLELRQNATSEQLTTLFDALSRLGPLVEYGGAKGEATMSYFSGSGGIVSALYVANARFKNGNAIFRIALLKRDGRWMIHNFHVDTAPGNPTGKGT